MEDMMGLMIRSLILSVIMGMSCQAFFETAVPRRKWRHTWMEYVAVPSFTVGFIIIAMTKIPPWILQPVRVIVVIVVVAQIFFQISFVKNLILSIIFCGMYWILSALFYTLISVTPAVDYRVINELTEPVLDVGYLCLMLVFRCRFRERLRELTKIRWWKFGLLAFSGIIVSIAVVMPLDRTEDGYVYFLVITGFVVVFAFSFYYMINALEKEAQVQKLRLLHEHTRNQMNVYLGMKKRFEQQRKFWHDYKNQLECIRGMLGEGHPEAALEYIAKLTGNFRQSEMRVDTNHEVVNILLNQKYQEAVDRGIVVTMALNDLSGLTVSEEDLVTLLGNLLDNAIEACGKLGENKIIQFKMILEDGQLVLSVRNPVKEPVRMKDNRIVTSKRDKSVHGIGLLNVDAVISKNGGTSVRKCEDGWFSFSAMIPPGGDSF